MNTDVREVDCDRVVAAIDAVRALSHDNLAGLPLMLLDRAWRQFTATSVMIRKGMHSRIEADATDAK
jgi:hypothetical protein